MLSTLRRYGAAIVAAVLALMTRHAGAPAATVQPRGSQLPAMVSSGERRASPGRKGACISMAQQHRAARKRRGVVRNRLNHR